MISVKSVKKLERNELVELVENLLHPNGKGFSSKELSDQLNLVCINCPDPSFAMDLIIETASPTTAVELVDRTLSCHPRDISFISFSKLAANHPLRNLRFVYAK